MAAALCRPCAATRSRCSCLLSGYEQTWKLLTHDKRRQNKQIKCFTLFLGNFIENIHFGLFLYLHGQPQPIMLHEFFMSSFPSSITAFSLDLLPGSCNLRVPPPNPLRLASLASSPETPTRPCPSGELLPDPVRPGHSQKERQRPNVCKPLSLPQRATAPTAALHPPLDPPLLAPTTDDNIVCKHHQSTGIPA